MAGRSDTDALSLKLEQAAELIALKSRPVLYEPLPAPVDPTGPDACNRPDKPVQTPVQIGLRGPESPVLTGDSRLGHPES